MKKRKRTTLNVEITYPAWMTAAQARREVRTLINHQVNYMTSGPDYQDVDLMTIRAASVKPEGRA